MNPYRRLMELHGHFVCAEELEADAPARPVPVVVEQTGQPLAERGEAAGSVPLSGALRMLDGVVLSPFR